MHLKKTVSLRKREANQRNAELSTGPKTREGKNAVRHNALKHGLLATDVVIKEGEAKEDPAQYEALLSQLMEDCQPVGILESLAVQEVADCYWRLRRAKRCEVGEIRITCDDLSDYLRNQRTERFNSCISCDKKLVVLGQAEEELEDLGSFSGDSLDRLKEHFHKEGRDGKTLADRCVEFNKLAAGNKKQTTSARSTSVEQVRKSILQEFESLSSSLELLAELAYHREERKFSALLALRQLPGPDSLDRILRYESKLKRDVYQALDHLERLQRQRAGDFVPAPVKVQIATER